MPAATAIENLSTDIETTPVNKGMKGNYAVGVPERTAL
jgi:hypothetical protein